MYECDECGATSPRSHKPDCTLNPNREPTPPVAGERIVCVCRHEYSDHVQRRGPCDGCACMGYRPTRAEIPPPAPGAWKEKHWSELPPETPPAAVPPGKDAAIEIVKKFDAISDCGDLSLPDWQWLTRNIASAVADAVSREREAIIALLETLHEGPHSDRCTCIDAYVAIRARSRDGGSNA